MKNQKTKKIEELTNKEMSTLAGGYQPEGDPYSNNDDGYDHPDLYNDTYCFHDLADDLIDFYDDLMS